MLLLVLVLVVLLLMSSHRYQLSVLVRGNRGGWVRKVRWTRGRGGLCDCVCTRTPYHPRRSHSC